MTRAIFQQGHDPGYMADPDPRSKPIPYVMTNRDRDDAHIVRLDIIAQTRREKLSDFVPGLVVTELSADDLSPEQRRALFGDDHEA